MKIPFSAAAVLAALLLLPSLLAAQDGKATLSIAKVATSPALSNKATGAAASGPLGQIIESLDNQLLVAISATRKFQVVALKDLGEVLNKQDLAASGNFEPRTSALSGRLEAAKYIVVVEVDAFQEDIGKLDRETLLEAATDPKTGKVDQALVDRGAFERTARLNGVAKIFDTLSGRLLEAADIAIQKSEIRFDAQAFNRPAGTADPLLRALSQETAQAIALHVADVIFPLKVLAKREKQVTLNRGEGGGVSAGQVWDVYAVGEDLLDEDTKEVLGREEVLIGKARITTVNPKTCIAELLEDRGVEKGAILRTPQPEVKLVTTNVVVQTNVLVHTNVFVQTNLLVQTNVTYVTAPPTNLWCKRTTGSARRTVLFGFIKWGDHTYAEGVGPVAWDELSKTKRAAAYRALANVEGDVLENPGYIISKRNFIILQRYQVQARGLARRFSDPCGVPDPGTNVMMIPRASGAAELKERLEQERRAGDAARARAQEEERQAREAARAADAEARLRSEQERKAIDAVMAEAEAKLREEERLAKEAAELALTEAKARREQERLQAENARAAAAAKAREEERLAREAAKQAAIESRLREEQDKLREAVDAKARQEQQQLAAEAARAAAAQAREEERLTKVRQEEERRAAAALKAQQEDLARQRAIAEQEAAKARAAAGLSGLGKPLTQGQIQRLANLYTSYSSNLISFGKYTRERAKIINE